MDAAAGRPPEIALVGDAALLVRLADALDLAANSRALSLAATLGARAAAGSGLGIPVPGHASVLVPFDPELTDEATVRAVIADAARASEPTRALAGALHEIPVRYGGPDGPDLAAVAAATGLAEGDVVRLHAGVEYRVLVLGFVPGFAYLGVLAHELELPRRASPRVRVPAGSIAISGRQSGIYPFAGPGGWHLLGRTDAWLWDPAADPPARFAPGDRVRFVPG